MSTPGCILQIERPGEPTEERPLPTGKRLVVGRAPESSDICLNYPEVSSKHLEIWAENGSVHVKDLGSHNGTMVGGSRLAGDQVQRVGEGQTVQFIGTRARIVILLQESAEPQGASDGPELGALAVDPRMLRALGDLKKDLRAKLLDQIGSSQRSRKQLEELVQRKLREIVDALPTVRLPEGVTRDSLYDELLDDILRLGPLEKLLRDEAITEVMVNGPNTIYYERAGRLCLSPYRFVDEQDLLDVIERILAPQDKAVSFANQMADARLADGSRVHVVIHPTSRLGPVVTIRKFPEHMYTAEDLIRMGSILQRIADFLKVCVQYRLNIIVSGGTSSGKTTLLNVLSNFISPNERVVTIEETAELRLQDDKDHPRIVPLEARPASQYQKGISIRQLVRNALRMRPDRIIVGECRGGEALDMLQAMNTGHDGSLTTVHANSAYDALARVETMCMESEHKLPLDAIRRQIASAIHLIVQQKRFLSDGSRRIMEVAEVTGIQGGEVQMQPIFEYCVDAVPLDGPVRGHYRAAGEPSFVEELRQSGAQVPPEWFSPGDFR